jgi:hypothetical protein
MIPPHATDRPEKNRSKTGNYTVNRGFVPPFLES